MFVSKKKNDESLQVLSQISMLGNLRSSANKYYNNIIFHYYLKCDLIDKISYLKLKLLNSY